MLQLVVLQMCPDGLKLTQTVGRKLIESAIIVFDDQATDAQVLETIEGFRCHGRKSLGIE